ncbi:MAG TPA: hypothetical protein VGU64_17725 [Terriglobales bacterium]|nr:hypothetical protein [Terriglobales bacterium]
MNKLTIALNRIGMPGGIIIFSVAALTLIVSSCATDKQAGGAAANGVPEKSGAQLWADNCQRCHNTRSPSSYNDAQWEVAMMHMRVRANLTPEEHKKILEFLKQGK